jgi:predicted DNA-binding protein (MmcQ/YjbR family)
MEQYQWLDECLLKLPGTDKEFQPAWQAYKYLLCGKMYAYIGNDKNGRPLITLKLEPAYSDVLRQSYADIVAGYYMNKVHWSSIYLDGVVPREVISDVVSVSHGWILATLSKKMRQEILDKYKCKE